MRSHGGLDRVLVKVGWLVGLKKRRRLGGWERTQRERGARRAEEDVLTVIDVLLLAVAQLVKVCSINLALCNSTWSTESE